MPIKANKLLGWEAKIDMPQVEKGCMMFNSLNSIHRVSQSSLQGGLRTKDDFKENYPSKPKITVITVVFNAVNTIESTIESVLSQTYDSVEYIVIDGGSTDGTLDILKKYDSKIDYWVSESDEGIYDAMNKGISLAKGEWVALLNSDDEYIDRDSLSKIAIQPIGCSVVASNVIMLTSEGEKMFLIDQAKPLYRNIPFMHTGIFIRRSVYQKLGVYDTKYSIASDIEFVYRMIHFKVTIKCIDSVLVRMRDDGASSKYFKRGRKEYRSIFMAYNGNILLAFYGYWYTIFEKKIYDSLLARKFFRYLKGLFR